MAPASPQGTRAVSGNSGSNGARCLSWPVTDSAPKVMPWKARSAETKRGRRVAARASFSAPSTASEPLDMR